MIFIILFFYYKLIGVLLPPLYNSHYMNLGAIVMVLRGELVRQHNRLLDRNNTYALAGLDL